MVNPPLFQVHWYENVPSIFGEEVHLKILPVFFNKKHSKDWTTFEELEENDGIVLSIPKKKFRLRWHPLLMILTFLTLPGPSTWWQGTDWLEYETQKILDHQKDMENKQDTIPETSGIQLPKIMLRIPMEFPDSVDTQNWLFPWIEWLEDEIPLGGPILRGYVNFSGRAHVVENRWFFLA